MENRTPKQNRALHTYLTLVAQELANQGQTMQNVVKLMSTIEIPPTKEAIKSVLWKPIQNTLFEKKSTMELTTAEVNRVYEVVAQFLANNFGISLAFPSEENSENYLKSYEN